MYKTIKERGRAASDYYAGREEYFSLSPAGLTLLRALKPLVREHCRGRVLDAGAGRGAYRDLLLESADEYVGMDFSLDGSASVVGDVQHLPFADSSFDAVFCSQVLEHVPEPCLALREFWRVLRPEGKLVLSVPHISWLHNEPHDYYRYTKHGLRFLLEQSELPLLRVEPAGGILALLGHIVSTIMINSTFGLPILHKMAFVVNSCFVKGVSGLDEFVEQKKIFALNYVAVSQKTTDRDPNGK